MFTDYYLVLGLTPEATTHQINKAFHALALRHDPDRAGETDARFVEISDAYETLSDPMRRAEYHRELECDPSSLGWSRPTAAPLWPEPLELLSSLATYRPSREEIVDHFIRATTGRGMPKSRRLGELNLEVVVSPAQSAQGGILPIDVPIAQLCAPCDGSGHAGFFRCDACAGHGLIWSHARIDVPMPANASDGTLLGVPLQELGIDGIDIRLHVRVSDA